MKQKKKPGTAWRQDKHKLSDSGEACNYDRNRQEPGGWWLHFTEQNICLIRQTKWSDVGHIFRTNRVEILTIRG